MGCWWWGMRVKWKERKERIQRIERLSCLVDCVIRNIVENVFIFILEKKPVVKPKNAPKKKTTKNPTPTNVEENFELLPKPSSPPSSLVVLSSSNPTSNDAPNATNLLKNGMVVVI